MTRKSIVDDLWKDGNSGLSKKTLYSIVNYIFDQINQALVKGQEVKISGFGTFRVRHTKGRRGRNPRTGETRVILSKRTIQLKPSKKLTTKLNLLAKRCKI